MLCLNTLMTKKSQITFSNWLQVGLRRITLVHFLLLGGYGIQTIIMDAWRVIVPELVLKRWLATGVMLTVTAGVWYLAHNRTNSIPTFKRLVFLLIGLDITFASFNVYIERGMASRGVALYLIAIAVSGLLLNRAALFFTAAVSVAAYFGTTVTYFVLNFNQGYKTELYSIVSFYSLSFFVTAAVLAIVVRFGGPTNDS